MNSFNTAVKSNACGRVFKVEVFSSDSTLIAWLRVQNPVFPVCVPVVKATFSAALLERALTVPFLSLVIKVLEGLVYKLQ
jgi:hypothetical protein